MPLKTGISDNLRFLQAELEMQLKELGELIVQPQPSESLKLNQRTGHLENLKQRVQNHCLQQVVQASLHQQSTDQARLRAAELIALEFGHIAELARESAKQLSHLSHRKGIAKKRLTQALKSIRQRLRGVVEALQASDSNAALWIGELEHDLDRFYKRELKRARKRLQRADAIDATLTTLFVAQRFEQMGDALLRIAEALLSANLGHGVTIQRYAALQAAIEPLELSRSPTLGSIAETRSGSVISRLQSQQTGTPTNLIVKEGEQSKLEEERAGTESWHRRFPGVAPQIHSFQRSGDSAALLIEHLPGFTFEQLVTDADAERCQRAMRALKKTLKSVWSATLLREPTSAHYMGQLHKRASEVFNLHPDFDQPLQQIGGYRRRALATLLNRANALEQSIQAPFSVHIHGDFNLDNILFDPQQSSIKFIDLHRSRQMDYLQDVSVFMVSCYRLQALDRASRQRALMMARQMGLFSRRFARQQGDGSFELRLGLALARSFLTSTRFILDRQQARAMLMRARYLLEQLVDSTPETWSTYQLPLEELFVV